MTWFRRLRKPKPDETKRWYELTDKAYERLLKTKDWSALTEVECELAAIWRLQADVNNGGYIQYYGNWVVGQFENHGF